VSDEALSVGDGAFARKSFDRIMRLKSQGKTILFCSHSLYQVEALCNKAIWIDNGRIAEIGIPSKIVMAYNENLQSSIKPSNDVISDIPQISQLKGTARIIKVNANCDGHYSNELLAQSRLSTLTIEFEYAYDPTLPPPSVAIVISDLDERKITSAGTANEQIDLAPSEKGIGKVSIIYNQLALLKGQYWIYALLMCEKGIHIYDIASMFAKLTVEQNDLEVGIVSLPHTWIDHNSTHEKE
jgi:lipopolysaccharide transport system ATP-binding protein